MEIRKLTIWDWKTNHSDLRNIYQGPCLEDYEEPIKAVKANMEWKCFRIVRIFDKVKNSVAVFRQTVTSRDDPCPTDITIMSNGMKGGVVLSSYYIDPLWCTDPQHADPSGPQVPCLVTDFAERVPTEEDKRKFTDSRRGPPTEADRQRWCEKEKANQRRAEAEEAVIRLAEKAYTDTPAKAVDKKTSKALSEKRAKAAKGNRTVKDKYDRAAIKAAVLRKIKQGYTSNQAHNEVADRCKDNQNLLKLKNGPYSFISARSVRRIVMNK